MAEFKKGSSQKWAGGRIRETVSGSFVAEINRFGRRTRQTFETENEARSWLDGKAEAAPREGEAQVLLSPLQVSDAVAALKLLRDASKKPRLEVAIDEYIQAEEIAESYGVDLLTLLKEAGEARAMLLEAEYDEPRPLVAAAEEVAERSRKSRVSWTVEEAKDHYLDHLENPKDGGSPARIRSIQNARGRLNKFCGAYGPLKITDVQAWQVEAWLDGLDLSGRSRLNYGTILQTMFNFAAREMDIGWVNTAAVYKQRKPKETKAVEFPTPEDTRKLLAGLEAYSPRYALAVALGCFAGLRTAEIVTGGGLQWNNIDFEENLIRIPAELAKDREARFVPIEPNLLEWLVRYRPEEGGRIAPNGPKLYKKVSEIKKERSVYWPKNAARHAYGTYGGVLFGYREASERMGHSGLMKIFNDHYKGLASRKVAEKFFKIRPEAEGKGEIEWPKGEAV